MVNNISNNAGTSNVNSSSQSLVGKLCESISNGAMTCLSKIGQIILWPFNKIAEGCMTMFQSRGGESNLQNAVPKNADDLSSRASSDSDSHSSSSASGASSAQSGDKGSHVSAGSVKNEEGVKPRADSPPVFDFEIGQFNENRSTIGETVLGAIPEHVSSTGSDDDSQVSELEFEGEKVPSDRSRADKSGSAGSQHSVSTESHGSEEFLGSDEGSIRSYSGSEDGSRSEYSGSGSEYSGSRSSRGSEFSGSEGSFTSGYQGSVGTRDSWSTASDGLGSAESGASRDAEPVILSRAQVSDTASGQFEVEIGGDESELGGYSGSVSGSDSSVSSAGEESYASSKSSEKAGSNTDELKDKVIGHFEKRSEDKSSFLKAARQIISNNNSLKEAIAARSELSNELSEINQAIADAFQPDRPSSTDTDALGTLLERKESVETALNHLTKKLLPQINDLKTLNSQFKQVAAEALAENQEFTENVGALVEGQRQGAEKWLDSAASGVLTQNSLEAFEHGFNELKSGFEEVVGTLKELQAHADKKEKNQIGDVIQDLQSQLKDAESLKSKKIDDFAVAESARESIEDAEGLIGDLMLWSGDEEVADNTTLSSSQILQLAQDQLQEYRQSAEILLEELDEAVAKLTSDDMQSELLDAKVRLTDALESAREREEQMPVSIRESLKEARQEQLASLKAGLMGEDRVQLLANGGGKALKAVQRAERALNLFDQDGGKAEAHIVKFIDNAIKEVNNYKAATTEA